MPINATINIMRSMSESVGFITQHGRLPLRERYWKRGDGRWRLRYVLTAYASSSALAAYLAMMILPLAATPITANPAVLQVAAITESSRIKPSAIPILAEAALVRPTSPIVSASVTPTVPAINDSWRAEDGQIRRRAEVRTASALVKQADDARQPRSQRLTIAPGDTLSGLLVQAGLDNTAAHAAISALRDHVRPGDLRPGQTLDLDLRPGADAAAGSYEFAGLRLSLDPVRTIEVKPGFAGYMNVQVHEKPLKADLAVTTAVVKGSLYGAAEAAGIPTSVTAEAIRAFAHQIDFQRDIHPGDQLEIVYDRMVTEDGYVARTGNVVYARLLADGRELTIYRFAMRDGRVDYFDGRGRSIRKALLRTPMDGARISSGFGMRHHPILGYSKMHKGIDFAASTGTPILSAGEGVIEKAGRFAAYGNYVRIRHTNVLKTAYAHMSRYADGIRPGARVRQGQVIGYVGTTGRSTGPHLHYEVLLNGDQVNPQSVKLPTMVVLEGAELKKFKDLVRRLDQEMKKHRRGLDMAAATPEDSQGLLVR